MKVTLIAHTITAPPSVLASLTGYDWSPEDDTTDADTLAEFAGRACYQSWSRPNPATASNYGYHRNTLAQGHFSIYEHASFTFYVEGVSRALTHELIRHRHLSFSQLSQRFVAEDRRDVGSVLPPLIRDEHRDLEFEIRAAHNTAMNTYERLVTALQDRGVPRKQAREAARAVLPNAQETKIVVTGNVRAWREFVEKRIDPAADAEIREFAAEVLDHLRTYAPNSVQDIEEGLR